ncbi:hypothetical protein SD70_14590 [Gordoniibacillus kamchatkensis]|uniref:Uncharacterized protein n=1 Tax=Gordoniibacillus kamchatkensis TaxID=1590651 RepID=A0ABR5AHT0_9BACL|nr:hypothetical protein [Paenibacillus sp. VKM B-2647]KIL40308.1 hypothetical protein SD70_14590 [Paenibacillus sp. VKM B-2647]
MNESVRNNLIGAAIAVCLLASVGAGGYVYYKQGPRGSLSGTARTEQQAAAAKDVPALIRPEALDDKRVHFDASGDINEAYVDSDGKVVRLYQLPPATLMRALELGMTKHEQSVEPVANLHERFHSMLSFAKTGSSGAVKETMTAGWDAFAKQNATLPELFDRMAAVNVNDGVKADFRNIAALLRIARDKHDAQAVIYAYRILHDLDDAVYNADREPLRDDPPPYGAAHAYKPAKKSQTAEIEAYIAKNRK